MSEAYQCDRCGSLREGEPHTALRLSSGLGRSRPGDPEARRYGEVQPKALDLCESCLGELVNWYADAGGDRSDVLHKVPGETDE